MPTPSARSLRSRPSVAPQLRRSRPLTVRITSPVDNEFLSGLVKMVAVVEPAPMERQIKEVVFFADGRKICTLTRLPFECDWDAGERVIEEHTVRVTVEMIKGGRTAASVHTKGVKFSEVGRRRRRAVHRRRDRRRWPVRQGA